MKPPAPASLRLVAQSTAARSSVPPLPPLGVREWSAEAVDFAVLLEGRLDEIDGPAVAAQLPDAGELAPATLVIVLPELGRPRGAWPRILRPRTASVARSARAEALLVRGYVDLGAAGIGPDDLVWAYAPR